MASGHHDEEAFGLLYHHTFGYIKTMALKCIVELGIPDAIHARGGAATLAEIAADTGVHMSRLTDLRSVMKLLTTSGLFSTAARATTKNGVEEASYELTVASSILVGPHGLSNIVRFGSGPVSLIPFFDMPAWLRTSPGMKAPKSLFELTHGRTRWDQTNDDNATMNAAAFAESQLMIEAILGGYAEVFHGLTSLVDVGGGQGSFAKAIKAAFPDIRCMVMDLPHVVADAPATAGSDDVEFIAGDMFKSIPSADAVLFKYVLHCWDHDNCVKILKRCKDAIPGREAGGKVVITEFVLGAKPKFAELEEMHSLFLTCISGVGREEHEWKKIFLDAGLSDYKITPVTGPLCVIEVYP